ncbi:N-acetyltransferase [Henriciella sp.]|uniref:GNAT family N-acetyltransferase n=1 Tax=Henriciella sp. TaxID=1968823 RepID=UPI002621F1C3|nr:N-acetyltransferase [Henriciella sp.]
MHIRPATESDADAIWSILESVLRAGETYTLAPDIPREAALAYWMSAEKQTFVCEDDGRILGTYYLKANQDGGGAHVCNCGYMTSPQARGRGVAGSMCEHSQEIARQAGFRAMQFNFVVSTNEGAIRLWKKLGYEIAGRLPGAFLHPREGYVDACIMYKTLV